jgi:hypothetical protein
MVLVRVRAAGVDRGGWHIMTGLAYPIRLAGFGLRAPRGKSLSPSDTRMTLGTLSMEDRGRHLAESLVYQREDQAWGL